MPRFTVRQNLALATSGTYKSFDPARLSPCISTSLSINDVWQEFQRPLVLAQLVGTRVRLPSITNATVAPYGNGVHYGEFIESAFPLSASVPAVTQLTMKEKPVSKYKDFIEKQRNGEIVLNPLHRVSLDVTTYPGVLKSSTTITPGAISVYHNCAEFNKLYPVVNTNCSTEPKARDYGRFLAHYRGSNDIACRTEHIQYSTNASLTQPLGESDRLALLEHIVSTLEKVEIDTGLITQTRAKSNEKILDLSTTLAEAPETLRSIMDLVKLILIKYQEVRKQVKVLKKNVIGGKPPVDFIAELWLRYRYEIMPNLMAIEDALTYLGSEVTEYMTTREGSRISLQIPSYKGWSTPEVTLHHRAYIKNRFDAKISSAQQSLGFHLGTTAWEMVPLSFVLDWVFNIGELIAGFGSPTGSVQEAAMYSTKAELRCEFTNPLWAGTPLLVQGKVYEAKIIQPGSHIGFNIQLDLNWKRKTDAIALLWLAFKDDFRTTLRKL